MLKLVKNPNTPEKKLVSYPALFKDNKSKMVVLFSDQYTGIVVDKGKQYFNVGFLYTNGDTEDGGWTLLSDNFTINY